MGFFEYKTKNGNASIHINLGRFYRNMDKAQKAFGPMVMGDMKPFMPHKSGAMQQLTYATEDGKKVIVDTPYAKYQNGGKVMEDPIYHCAGFMTENGWRSRKGVKKVLTDRDLHYTSPYAKPHWANEAKKKNCFRWLLTLARIMMKGK